jgi:class 3 adenylate cyclase
VRLLHPADRRLPAALEQRFQADLAERRRPQARTAMAVGAAMYAGFGIVDALVFPDAWGHLALLRYAIGLPAVLVCVAALSARLRAAGSRARDRWMAAGIIVAGLAIVGMVPLVPAETAGFHGSGLTLVIFFAWGLSALPVRVAGAVAGVLGLAWFAVSALAWDAPAGLRLATGLLVLGAELLGAVLALHLERAERRRFLADLDLAAAREDAESERQKADRLLLNILPAHVARDLKDRGSPAAAEEFDEASVLFLDIVGFTPYARGRAAAEVVRLLNHVFSALDTLCEVHGVEKIKTIGDAYLAVCGAPVRAADHAARICRLALAVRAELPALFAAEAPGLAVRIGIHSGPLVAGIIGHRKFAYDLWGDTVNLASRMESHGAPGRIHISHATRERLGDAFVGEARGPQEVRGAGAVETFWLDGLDEAAVSAGGGASP